MNLHHRLDGPEGAPVLVLANSLGTTLELWEANVGALTASHRVLRFDQRGHGRSPVPPGPYRVEGLAADVLELLDALELERAHFCGISLGGAVGLCLGATAPERIERLVVVCSSARFVPSEGWLERARLVREQGLSAISELVMRRWFTRAWAAGHPEEAARFRRMLESTPVDGYAASCEAVAAWDFHDRLAEVRVPTLVISASEDEAAPAGGGRAVADGVPGARFVLVQAAHLANVEQPEELSCLVLEHVSSRVVEPA
jgi:3-oxoadipate enol-lactonase